MNLANYNQDWFDRGRSKWIVALWYLIQATLFRYSFHNMYGFRRMILKLFGCSIGKNVLIRNTCEITYPWKVSIGENSWIDHEVILYSLDNIAIGKNTSISRRSYICTGSHDISDSAFGLVVKPIKIGDGVWIQADCFISLGVEIGNQSVIGTRSSVLKSMPPGMVCYGNPCKVVREREYKNETDTIYT
jgi:putative colanic acid biosynthesis acetyltransferase WcaF